MIFQNDAPIIQKMSDFYKMIYETIKLFPKDEKFTIGEKIKNLVLKILENLIEAEFSLKYNKIKLLEKASVKLDLLKLLIRICYELKLINLKKYIQIEKSLQEIGRMLGGWIKSTKAS